MQPTNQFNTMTGTKQTMSTWSNVIDSREEIPTDFRDLFNTLPDAGGSFPYTVFAPRITQLPRRSPENMICDINQTWHILKNTDGELTLTSYPLKNISDIEFGHILLYSWITINGKTLHGEAASSSIEFNAATTRHYNHFFDQFKPAAALGQESSLETERTKFDTLAPSTFKFMNDACISITPVEEVIHFVWQPEIQVPRFSFRLFPFTRTLTTAHLLILTDKQVILLREDERSQRNKGIRYGGVRHFIPLHSIASSSLSKTQDGFLSLALHLDQGRHLDWLFEETCQQALEQFQTKLYAYLNH